MSRSTSAGEVSLYGIKLHPSNAGSAALITKDPNAKEPQLLDLYIRQQLFVKYCKETPA